jgi:hypothetical protein
MNQLLKIEKKKEMEKDFTNLRNIAIKMVLYLYL